jgi:hypothetical protein
LPTVIVLCCALLVTGAAQTAAAAGSRGGVPGPVTVSSPDGFTFRSTVDEGTTRLEWVASGDAVPVTTFDRALELRLVEPRGRRVVLADPLPRGGDRYNPGGRSSTTLVVVDTERASSRTFHLSRNVEPEAFGVGSPSLFLIDHRPAANPTHYRVGGMSIETGEYFDLRGPDKEPLGTDMTGTARRQVFAPSGGQLYTLYTQHGHDQVGARGPTASFVHVLDLDGGWAYCADLPRAFGHGADGTASIATDGTGSRVFVVDTHARRLAVLDARTLTASHLARGAPGIALATLPRAIPRQAPVHLEQSLDGVTLSSSGVTRTFDVATSRFARPPQ